MPLDPTRVPGAFDIDPSKLDSSLAGRFAHQTTSARSMDIDS